MEVGTPFISRFRSSSDLIPGSSQSLTKLVKRIRTLDGKQSSLDSLRPRDAGRAVKPIDTAPCVSRTKSPDLSRHDSVYLMALKSNYTESLNKVRSALCEVYSSTENEGIFNCKPEKSEEFKKHKNFRLNIHALLFSDLTPNQAAIESMIKSVETSNWFNKEEIKQVLNSVSLSDDALEALREIQETLSSFESIDPHDKLNDAINQLSGSYYLLTNELNAQISSKKSNFCPSDKPNVLPSFVWEASAPKADH